MGFEADIMALAQGCRRIRVVCSVNCHFSYTLRLLLSSGGITVGSVQGIETSKNH
jgi:hypothetical protein